MNAPSEAGTKNEKEQSSTLKSRPNGARERARRGDAGGGGPSRGARASRRRAVVYGACRVNHDVSPADATSTCDALPALPSPATRLDHDRDVLPALPSPASSSSSSSSSSSWRFSKPTPRTPALAKS